MPNRQNRRGRSNTSGPFVQLHHWMMRTAAWRSLTAQARVLYIEVAMLYNGRNNGSLALSVRQAAERCNIAKDTAARAFRELAEKGLLECVTPGGFDYKLRHAAEWRLTQFPCDKTGALPSKAFMRWS